MAFYAIGDVQGCYGPLCRLLDRLHFDPARDRLWFAGDLVNRGPASARVLRLLISLGAAAQTVLGNHDLHLLAAAAGVREPRPRDTFTDVLHAPDREELLDWLRRRPLIMRAPGRAIAMVHAGLLPCWDVSQAAALANEVERALRGSDYPALIDTMYGNEPAAWSEDLAGPERWRCVINAMTRMRFCDAQGRMDFHFAGPPGSQPGHLLPWYEVPGRRSADQELIFGHWSALGCGRHGRVLSLDGGCVWNRTLCAVRLDEGDGSDPFLREPCGKLG
jgi:bis(5'-nucleosyl)-tetraphosphatase (symmetrical)